MATLSMESLQSQLHSARKSLLFMETQHAATLKGLHAEIQKLQKKCSELTFEAAMQAERTKAEVTSANVVDQLRKDVADLTKEKVTMLQLLEDKDRQFVELERDVMSREKKYLNELKIKGHRITALNSEIESRANTVAYLTVQLHQTQSRLFAQQKQTVSVAPAPPSKPKSSSHVHRNSKSVDANFRPLSSGSNPTVSRLVKVSRFSRPSSASCVSAVPQDKPGRLARKSGINFTPSPMPDPTPFLHAAENAEVLPEVRPPSVLPPIAKRPSDANGNTTYSMTSYPLFQARDGNCERFPQTESIAVRRYDSSSPEQKVKGGNTRTPVGDGTTL